MRSTIKEIKLSIITVNLDNAAGLLKTVKSIASQTYSDFEFLIIDGASKDVSIDIIKKNSDRITYWISEPDAGIYNAMNKGIKKASGDYFLFLNSGDYFYSDNVIEKFISGNPREDIITGDVVIKHNTGLMVVEVKKSPESLTAKYLINDYLPHSATFIKRALFERVGLYNENNKIVSDWEFFLNAFLHHNASYKHLTYCISVFMTDGISCKPENAELIAKEKQNILVSSFPYIYRDYAEFSAMENKNQQYIKSDEYMAFLALKKTGIISLLILLRKAGNKISKNTNKVLK